MSKPTEPPPDAVGGASTSIKRIMYFALMLAAILLIVYIAVCLIGIIDPSSKDVTLALQESIESIAQQAWEFSMMPAQLLVMLLVAQWFAERVGLKLDFRTGSTSFGIQAFIAVVVIGSYCIAVLVGAPHVNELKDIALIVVGFYFGTRSNKAESNKAAAAAAEPNSSPGN